MDEQTEMQFHAQHGCAMLKLSAGTPQNSECLLGYTQRWNYNKAVLS